MLPTLHSTQSRPVGAHQARVRSSPHNTDNPKQFDRLRSLGILFSFLATLAEAVCMPLGDNPFFHTQHWISKTCRCVFHPFWARLVLCPCASYCIGNLAVLARSRDNGAVQLNIRGVKTNLQAQQGFQLADQIHLHEVYLVLLAQARFVLFIIPSQGPGLALNVLKDLLQPGAHAS